MTSRMPERARTDPWEPQGSNPLGPPGPEPGVLRSWISPLDVIESQASLAAVRIRPLMPTIPRPVWLRLAARVHASRLQIAVNLQDVVESRSGLGPILRPRAEAAGANDMHFLLVPIADEFPLHFMHVAMQRQAHPVLLEIAKEFSVLHLLRAGNGVMPDRDPQQRLACWQGARRPGVLLLLLGLLDRVRHGFDMHARPLPVEPINLPARI